MTSTMGKWERLQNAAHRLNAEAYVMQIAERKGKPLKQFSPCPKATILTAACSDKRVMSLIENEVALTHCRCHSGLTINKLMDYEFDPTYRVAHYNHDYKTLYGR